MAQTSKGKGPKQKSNKKPKGKVSPKMILAFIPAKHQLRAQVGNQVPFIGDPTGNGINPGKIPMTDPKHNTRTQCNNPSNPPPDRISLYVKSVTVNILTDCNGHPNRPHVFKVCISAQVLATNWAN